MLSTFAEHSNDGELQQKQRTTLLVVERCDAHALPHHMLAHCDIPFTIPATVSR